MEDFFKKSSKRPSENNYEKALECAKPCNTMRQEFNQFFFNGAIKFTRRDRILAHKKKWFGLQLSVRTRCLCRSSDPNFEREMCVGVWLRQIQTDRLACHCSSVDSIDSFFHSFN